MDFFKKLFEYLFHKENLITKKVHTLGAVVVTACLVSLLILGVNGFASTMYNETTVEEQNITALENEKEELEELEIEEDDLTLQLALNDIERFEMIYYIDYLNSQAQEQADEHQLAIQEEETNTLSTASSNGEVEEDEIEIKETLITISEEEVDVTPNRDPIALTENDYEVLLTIVEAEVGTEDLTSRMMIANVIINRMQHDYYPSTIEDVVFQNDGQVYQFSPILDKRYWKVTVSSLTHEAVNNALAGYDNSKGALAFVNREITAPSIMSWFDNNLIFVMKHGKVEYFTFYL